MDQLKQYLEVAKKHHFWILCGLAVLVPFIVFWVSSNYLAKVYADQKGKFSRANQEVQPLASGDHPNNAWVERVHQETEQLRANVRQAWDTLYTDQQKNVFIWPNELGPDFIAAFSKPAAADDPRQLEPLCERYQNHVKTEISHMADIVRAEWNPSETGGRGGALQQHVPNGAAAEGAEAGTKNTIVEWAPADEGHLVDDYDWIDPPSPLDVRYAQEELWVLEAICKAIDRTNVGATGQFDAVVREIHSTLIGYDATDKFPLGEGADRIERPHGAGRAPGALGPGPMAGPMVPGGVPGALPGAAFEPKRPMRHRTADQAAAGPMRLPGGFGVPGGPGGPGGIPGQMGPVDPEAWLKDGRYVDSAGKPLLGSAWANVSTPEYNLMAFKITIAADEQHWQRLLVELANSQLPLEVREVRMNPLESRGGRGEPPLGRNRPGRDGDQGGKFDNVTLEIHGVAYLMNPPNLDKLGIKAATANGSPAFAAAPPIAAPAPPATPPAATAPATATPTTATPTTVPPTTVPPASPVTPPAATGPATAPPATTPPAKPPAAGAPPTPTTPATAPPPVAAPPAALPAK